jgi:hypothetical protein
MNIDDKSYNKNVNIIPITYYSRKNSHWQDKVSTKYCVKSTKVFESPFFR